ncbi:MAG: hypothetical protein IPN07_00540 [Dehalococcoidia bacterium]|nr:hypothetical protein [Dehalococcoidia bacterium]
MSKEIAQTVGGKRIAWLIAIVAAFAVMATLGTQWQKSEAALPTAAVTLTGGGSTTPGGAVAYTATFTFNPSGSVAAGGAGTFSVDFDDDLVYVSTTGTGIAAIDTADCSNGAGNVVTCGDDAGDFWTDGTLIFNFTNPLAGGTISVAGTCTLTDVTSVSCTNSTAGATVANAVQVTPETATNAMGVAEVYSFALPAGYTCASDDADDATRTCAIGDVNVSAGLTVVSGPTVADSVLANASAVTVTVINSSTSSTGGTVSLDVSTSDDGGTDFISEVGTKTYVEAELRHIADDASVITGQEINSNVRGSRHTICTVAEGTSNAIQILA